MNKQVVAYLRYSTGGQDLATQRFKIVKYAEEHEYEIVEWFIDTAKSGALEERPELIKLKEWVPGHEGWTVLFVNTGRLARSKYIFVTVGHLFEQYGIEAEYLNFTPSGNLAMDRFMLGVLSDFDEWEKEVIFQRFKDGRTRKISENKKAWGGPSKYGFKLRVVPLSRDRNDYFYEIEENEAENVRFIYKLFLSGEIRIQGICRELAEKGLKTRNGSLKWAPTTVRGILTDTIYFGEFRYGKTETVWKKGKKQEVPRPFEEQSIVQVPPIITREDFDRVQGIIESYRARKIPKQNNKNKNLLTGLIRCGKCHYRYTGWRRSSKKIEDKWFYYRCNSINQYDPEDKSPACGNPAIMGYQAEDIVWTELVKILLHPEKIWKNTGKNELKDYENKLGLEAWNINKRINKIKEERNRIFNYAAKGIFDEARVISGQNDLNKEEGELKTQLHSIVEKRVLLEYAYGGKPYIPQHDTEIYADATFERKRDLILRYVKEIIVTPSSPIKLLIVFNIPIKPVSTVVTTNKDPVAPS